MKTLGIIPARFASTRFPGKPLALLKGKPIIRWVWETASLANELDDLVVATDDGRIARIVEEFGGKAILTRSDHLSGTDRCAEALDVMGPRNWSRVINIQGDEPFIDPRAIDQLVATLRRDGAPPISTLARPVSSPDQLFNPNVVKVVVSVSGRALYFSRHPVPFCRGADLDRWMAMHAYFQHIGIYGFSAKALPEITGLPPSALEKAESLEQLRWLENDYQIAVGITDYQSVGIDTPEDLEKAEIMLGSKDIPDRK